MATQSNQLPLDPALVRKHYLRGLGIAFLSACIPLAGAILVGAAIHTFAGGSFQNTPENTLRLARLLGMGMGGSFALATIAIFISRPRAYAVPVKGDRDEFVKALAQKLRLKVVKNDSFEALLRSGIAGPKIAVTFEGDQAHLVGANFLVLKAAAVG